jgi:hypothetical protein
MAKYVRAAKNSGKNTVLTEFNSLKNFVSGLFKPKSFLMQKVELDLVRKRAELRSVIEQSVILTKRPFIYWSPDIPQVKLNNGRLLTNREEILTFLPKDSVGVEVGTQYGEFAKKIIQVVRPREFHLLDISYELFDHEWFANKNVNLHTGNSWELLSRFENDFFDWIYIDASHAYDNFRRDLEMACKKVKLGGLIVCNDYTVWSPAEVEPYGILQFVHEFLQEANFEVAFLAFHGMGYHDIALRRML